eukprot:RCo020784
MFTFRTIPIAEADLLCLPQDNNLNDNVIDFYLQVLARQLERQCSPRRDEIHFFNSHFHACLSSPATRPEDLAQRWDKAVKLFSKTVIFIPFNETEHWLLFVLLNLSGRFPGLPSPTLGPAAEGLPLAAGGAAALRPILLFLDSFPGPPPSQTFLHRLQAFLQARARHEQLPLVEVQGFHVVSPRVPIQPKTNFTDCGVYVLHYIELLCLEPLLDRLLQPGWPLLKEEFLNFSGEEVKAKREFIARLMHGLCEAAASPGGEGASAKALEELPLLEQECPSVVAFRKRIGLFPLPGSGAPTGEIPFNFVCAAAASRPASADTVSV